MDVVALSLSIMAITPSGAFSPGPLTASAVANGSIRGWRAGLYTALGHTAFELPYVAALVYATGKLNLTVYKTPLAIAAFVFIAYFAYLLLKDSWRILHGSSPAIPRSKFANPLAAGFALTALNPYFLLWWVTIAAPVVITLAGQPLHVFLIVYTAHVWMDYFWLTLMAALGNAATKLLSTKGYAVFLALLAILLLYFGIELLRGLF